MFKSTHSGPAGLTFCRPANDFRRFLSICLLVSFLTFLPGCSQRNYNEPTSQMDAPAHFWIRVLLSSNRQMCKIRSSSACVVINPNNKKILAKFFVPVTAKVSGRKIIIGNMSFVSPEIVIAPAEPYIFKLNGSSYRGRLKLIRNNNNKLDIINLVPLEPYLAGVVGCEMPDYWEPEALKAQAVAARTYCLYIKKRFGKNRSWDLSPTQAHQVYRGVSAESAQIWQSVNKTKGQVLTCRHEDGRYDIFPAYYSSACGGHTANSTSVFGGKSLEPLKGVPCPWCKEIAKPKFFFWPMITFDAQSITESIISRYPSLGKLGKIRKIEPNRKSNYGSFARITSVRLAGSTGKKGFLRAEDLRLTIDPTGTKIKSTICRILNHAGKITFSAGRGYGHGVGLCQCGAQALARKGKTERQILAHYFPASRIENVY